MSKVEVDDRVDLVAPSDVSSLAETGTDAPPSTIAFRGFSNKVASMETARSMTASSGSSEVVTVAKVEAEARRTMAETMISSGVDDRVPVQCPRVEGRMAMSELSEARRRLWAITGSAGMDLTGDMWELRAGGTMMGAGGRLPP
jgi:hypothetical protein